MQNRSVPAEEKEKPEKRKDGLWTQPEIFDAYEEGRKISDPEQRDR